MSGSRLLKAAVPLAVSMLLLGPCDARAQAASVRAVPPTRTRAYQIGAFHPTMLTPRITGDPEA
jgi:hypothetical protein